MLTFKESFNEVIEAKLKLGGGEKVAKELTKLGRKKITNPKMTAQIISLHNENKSIRAIASQVGVSTATVQGGLKKAT